MPAVKPWPLVFTAVVLGMSLSGRGSLAAPPSILARALKGPTVPYEGVQETTVYTATDKVVSRVSIKADGKGGVWREFLTGPTTGTILLQVGASAWQKGRDTEFVRLPSSGGSDPATTAERITTNYNVTVNPAEPVLGRAATFVRITPRQKYNPSRHLVVDRATGLILKDELFAPDGKPRSATVFVELRFRPQPSDLFVPPANAANPPRFGPASFEALRSEADVQRTTGSAPARPSYVPPGFEVVAYGVVTTARGTKTGAVRYSDGLAAYTVFTRPRMGGGPGPGPGGWGGGPRRRGQGMGGPPWRVGSVNVTETRQQAMVTYTSRTGSYVLIGDIAASELEKIARSLP